MTGTLHVVLAMKPISGNFSSNALTYGVSGLNIDAVRIETRETLRAGSGGLLSNVRDHKDYPNDNGFRQSAGGRWPANVIHDGSGAVLGAFAEAGERRGMSGGGAKDSNKKSEWVVQPFNRRTVRPEWLRSDGGSAARFFRQITEV